MSTARTGSFFGPGKEISYPRAFFSALPFAGVVLLVANIVQCGLKSSENNQKKISRKCANQTETDSYLTMDPAAEIANRRITQLTVEYGKLGVLSAGLSILVLVVLAASGKMPSRLVALSIIPCATGLFSGALWYFNKQRHVKHLKTD